MKSKIYIVFFFIVITIKSQNASVEYRATLKMPEMSEMLKSGSSKLIKQMKSVISKNKDLICNLDIVDNESVFYINPSMNIESDIGSSLNMTKLKVGNGRYYVNLQTKKIIQEKNSFGEDFRIFYPSLKWKITNEQKKIGKYKCTKATTKVYVESRRGREEVNVTAWFTTSVPYNFGPKRFSGLPGLILELHEGKLSFYAQKINLHKPLLKVVRPIKGKKVTLKEFNAMAKRITRTRM